MPAKTKPKTKRTKQRAEKTRGSKLKHLTPGEWFEKLVAVQARLRAPKGCPWDREQTHETLRTYLLEEAYEVLEALDTGDDRKFAEEMGDLLLQIVFHSQIAQEEGRFSVADVIREIHDKMIRRHPHVFGETRARDSAEVLRNWERIKAEERRARKEEGENEERQGEAASLLDGVSRSLPGTLEGLQLTRKASRIGFDWQNADGVMEKIREETAELELQRQIWGEADLEVEPATLFVVAAHTGGQVLGAFEDGRLIGYTLAVVGLRNGTAYLHSHMTGVQNEYRDRGVGRMLKLFQRQEALSRGIRLVQWTFDPLELRNAHFNLNRLGAICRQYLPNLYGTTTSPLHRGMATDRLLVEWHLDSKRAVAAIQNLVKEPVEAPGIIELPAELGHGMEMEKNEPEISNTQSRLREEFTKWFAKGYAAVGLRNGPRHRAYLLTPWSDF